MAQVEPRSGEFRTPAEGGALRGAAGWPERAPSDASALAARVVPALAGGDPAVADAIVEPVRAWLRAVLARGAEAASEPARALARALVAADAPVRRLFDAVAELREGLVEIVLERGTPGPPLDAVRALCRVADRAAADVLGAYVEIHERERLATLEAVIVENMPATVLCLDGRGFVRAATRPSARLFAPAVPSGRHYEDFLPESLVEAADLPSHVGRALATNRPVTLPHVAVRLDGRDRHFGISLVPLRHDLARLLLRVEELTEVVEATARARRAQDLARLGRLAANVAHEIRNPIAAISAPLQIIARSLEDADPRRSVLDRVQEQVRRIDRLVTDLLGYAEPVTPRPRAIRLAEVASRAAAPVGAAVRVVEDAEALADRAIVERVLAHLLDNAREAAGPEGAVAVEVGPGPVLSVSDSGPGVPPEVAARIFEPFFTTRARGTGLGLAIGRKLAEAMDGRLELVEPGPEGGARFRLALPAAPAAASSRRESSTSALGRASRRARLPR